MVSGILVRSCYCIKFICSRIGVNGFGNPQRDVKTSQFKEQIGKGCKLKMDDSGNILVKRISMSNIYVKSTEDENAVSKEGKILNRFFKCVSAQVSNEVIKLSNGLLELEKPFKLFDMKKFQQNVNRELKRKYPKRIKLEIQVKTMTNNNKHKLYISVHFHPFLCEA